MLPVLGAQCGNLRYAESAGVNDLPPIVAFAIVNGYCDVAKSGGGQNGWTCSLNAGTHGNSAARIVRISWALLGGLWGAWLGFGGHFRLPSNADSFATFFATGFFSFFAVVGFASGMAVGVLVGGLTEKLLRHLGVGTVGAALAATLVSAAVLWQVGGVVQAKLPGLRAPVPGPAVSPARETPPEQACDKEPPANSPQHASWEAECR